LWISTQSGHSWILNFLLRILSHILFNLFFQSKSFKRSINILIEVLDIQGSGSTIDSVLKGILPVGAMAGAATAPIFMRFLTRK
jgi:hypothetical protein